MDPRYLERVARACTRFVHHYEGAPLVIVNAAEIDFAHGDADYELLFDKAHYDLQGPALPESAAAVNARGSPRASRDCIITPDAPPALAN